jgi:hypothetical protein
LNSHITRVADAKYVNVTNTVSRCWPRVPLTASAVTSPTVLVSTNIGDVIMSTRKFW